MRETLEAGREKRRAFRWQNRQQLWQNRKHKEGGGAMCEHRSVFRYAWQAPSSLLPSSSHAVGGGHKHTQTHTQTHIQTDRQTHTHTYAHIHTCTHNMC